MDDSSLDIYRQILMDGPGGWRIVRELFAFTAAGEVAERLAGRCGYSLRWDRNRFIATHEMGHVFAKFFVAGTLSGAAITEGGGVAGGLWTKPEEAQEAWSTCPRDAAKTSAAKSAVSQRQLAALERLPRALERLFSRPYVQAALLELSQKLYEEGFIDGRESYLVLAGWFPRSAAFRRVQTEYRPPAPAPGLEGCAGAGAGSSAGDLCPDRAGGNGPAAGAEGARTGQAGRDVKAGSDPAREMD